jgi:hypothetical protein
MTPRDHAFFVRAREVLTPAPSPFITEEDERVDVQYCPWIGARAPLPDRMSAMARVAVHEAIFELGTLQAERIPAYLCTDDEAHGMPEAAIAAVRNVVHRGLRSDVVTACCGDAGTFAALRKAIDQLESGALTAVAVVAVDSYVDASRLAEARRVPPPYWESDPPQKGEAAAAIVLTTHAVASARKLPVQGTVYGAAVAAGSATDENDEPVDGVALTTVFRGLPEPATIFTIFGQRDVSGMRYQEFQIAVARNAARFARVTRAECLEAEIGRVGAAAGLANLVFGVATMRHGAMRNDAPRTSPFCAWAISRDGTRGAAVAAAVQP